MRVALHRLQGSLLFIGQTKQWINNTNSSSGSNLPYKEQRSVDLKKTKQNSGFKDMFYHPTVFIASTLCSNLPSIWNKLCCLVE